jgi:hypothetical protein
MPTISDKIQVFNTAYKIAWDLAVEHKINAPDLARKINDAVRIQMKLSDDPAAVAEAAFHSL